MKIYSKLKDYCRKPPCKNGYCVSGLYGYECNCKTGYAGKNCEKKGVSKHFNLFKTSEKILI